MEQRCDTCGNIGVTEALVTCSGCKLSRHEYCMTSLVIPDIWRCEECESGTKIVSLASARLTRVVPIFPKSTNSAEVNNDTLLPSPSKKLSKEPRKGLVDWEKKVERGKTKYLSAKEAIMLSSGADTTLPNLNVTGSYSKSQRPPVGVSKPQKTTRRPKTVSLNSFYQQDLASRPSRQLMPQRNCAMEVSEGHQQPSLNLTGSVKHHPPDQAPVNNHMQEEQQPEEVMKQPFSASLDAPPVTLSGIKSCTILELWASDAENKNANLVPDSEDFWPALDALWKGSFNLLDDLKQGIMSHEIQAHSPSLVRRKVYDFSKKMPDILHFELVSREQNWLNFFPEYVPDKRDIGLYFFPSDTARADNYTSLLDCIAAKNLALRKQIADVELLVFTSDLLPEDCQCWHGKKFMWGVFHKLKGNATTCLKNKFPVRNADGVVDGCNRENDCVVVGMDVEINAGVSVGNVDVVVQCTNSKVESATAECVMPVSRNTGSVIPSLSIKSEPHDDIPPGFVDDSVEVDMDVDMIGGVNVGRVDVVVQCTSSKEESATAECVISFARNAGSVVPSPSIKSEPLDDIPPGFEETFRLRIFEGSPPIAKNLKEK